MFVRIFERGLNSSNYTNYKSVAHNDVVEGGLVMVTGHAQGGYRALKLLSSIMNHTSGS